MDTFVRGGLGVEVWAWCLRGAIPVCDVFGMFPKQAMALIICHALHICQVELAAMAAGVAGDSLGVLEGLVSEHHGAQYVNSPLFSHDAPHQPANQSCPCAPTSSLPPPLPTHFFSPPTCYLSYSTHDPTALFCG